MRTPKRPAPPPSQPASAAAVARLAGVSRSAVSRAFTDGASVSDQTREKVFAAAKDLNYHVNHLARGISKAESRPVCLLASNLNKPYHGVLLDAITRRLQIEGRMAMIINVTADPQSAQAALEQALSYRAAASVVMSGTPPEAMVETCIQAGQKVILINRNDQIDGVHHIQVDYRTAMEDAVFMLKRANCQNIGLISSLKGTPSLIAREKLFLKAAHETGIPCQSFHVKSSNYDDGVAAARSVLAGRNRPDGVFCINDLIASGFIDAAQQDFGIKIPDDLNVIGFDDIPQASWGAYDITTFTQPYEGMALRIAEILKNDINGSNVQLPAVLRWRGSVRLSPTGHETVLPA